MLLTFSPLALLMALRGLRTLRTRKIFTTLIALDLGEGKQGRGVSSYFGGAGNNVMRGCVDSLTAGQPEKV